ncbi:aspartate/glutamate racemase family protein [Frankia canadensis]|nr:aspartate/glutamate racemase family protein [Frankia canadensis]
MSAVDAPVRIWHQSMATLAEFGPYQDLLATHIAAVAPAGVTVDVHGISATSYGGRAPAHVLRYPYLRQVIQTQAIDLCRQAQAEGYDAVALATFGDPYLRECRSMVDIPIASMPESALAVAGTLAGRAALISLGPGGVGRLRELVDGFGVSSRVSGIHPLNPPVAEDILVRLMSEPTLGAFAESLEAVGREAAAAGAEILIPAEGALNELLWSRRVTTLAGLPVLDGLGVTLAYTTMLVHLRRAGGLGTSRVSTYATPPADWVAEIENAVGEARGGTR